MWHIRSVLPAPIIGMFVFLFGLMIGSFLNVCIVRIPQRKSIVMPASACPKCGAPIRPYDNIPVLSWLLLGGKCRACKAKISGMYPLVELLTALLFLGCYRVSGLTIEALKWAIFSALMIVLVFTDLRERILPDVVNYTGFALGLALSFVTLPTDGTALWAANRMFEFPPPAPVISFAGCAAGRGARQRPLVARLGSLFSAARARRNGHGRREDDAHGRRVSGQQSGRYSRFLPAHCSAASWGSHLWLARRKDSDYELPFGTFLGMAALLVVFFGTPVVNWYQSILLGR